FMSGLGQSAYFITEKSEWQVDKQRLCTGHDRVQIYEDLPQVPVGEHLAVRSSIKLRDQQARGQPASETDAVRVRRISIGPREKNPPIAIGRVSAETPGIAIGLSGKWNTGFLSYLLHETDVLIQLVLERCGAVEQVGRKRPVGLLATVSEQDGQ